MTQRRRRVSGRRFIQLWTNVKRSEAYHGLSCHARAFIIELLDRYNGCNNGFIALGVREAVYVLGCSRDTARRAMREVDDAGLAQPTAPGCYRGKQATEWRLTFYRCDKTGDLPQKNFPAAVPYQHSDERQRDAEYDRQYRRAKRPNVSTARGTEKAGLEVRKANVSALSGTENEKNPISRSGVSTVRGPHIDIYHGDRPLIDGANGDASVPPGDADIATGTATHDEKETFQERRTHGRGRQ